jgi:hypothetical protein
MTELRINIKYQTNGAGEIAIDRLYRDDANENEKRILDIVYLEAKEWFAVVVDRVQNTEGCSGGMTVFGESEPKT